MKSKDVFELFNHFFATGDTTQILPMSDSLEVFSSATFSDGQTKIGSDAPQRFRDMILEITRSNKQVNLDLEYATIEDNSALIFMNVSKGRKTSGSALNILISDGQLKCFHEAAAAL